MFAVLKGPKSLVSLNMLVGFSLLLLFPLFASADSKLQRTAFLGVSPVSAASGQQVEVSNLHPDGTGMAIGLKEGDKLLQVNGSPVGDFSHLIELLNGTLEGDSLSLLVIREDEELTLTGAVQSRPRESGTGYTTDYDEFNWNGNHIRTITYHPEKPRSDGAAVMFIQGYTCDSIDYGMAPEITITQLLATYAEAGFTVFKMEKPGVGDSTGSLSCSDIDFDTENSAFIAGLEHFKITENIDADKLFVFGHSLGVLHAAIMAEQGLAAGVMGYGGVLKSWYQYLQAIYAEQSVKYFNVSQSQAESNLKTVKPFLDFWLNSNEEWSQRNQNNDVKKALESDLLPINGEQVFQRHYSFFRSLNQHDFRALWRASKSHMLMMHGTYDIQAIDGQWANDIVALVDDSDDITAQAMFFERTEHALMRYPSLDAMSSARSGRTYNPGNPGEHYNPDVAVSSLQWMQRILESQNG